MSNIEWTMRTWNPFVAERLELPLKTRKPTTWFVNSMSDLFHESVTDEQLFQIMKVIRDTPHHTYQVLTKRPGRMLDVMKHLSWRTGKYDEGLGFFAYRGIPGSKPLPNLWLGVTVENQKAADERIPLLLQTPAAVRFLSCEPLLEEVNLSRFAPFCWERIDPEMTSQLLEMFGGPLPEDSLNAIEGRKRIDWVIVGGESGHGARPCKIDWLHSIVSQCADANVPCFIKQLGSEPAVSRAEDLWILHKSNTKGNDPEQWPQYLRVRQFPKVAIPA